MLFLFLVLLILWALGVFAFHVTAALIHILLIVAVIFLVLSITGGRNRL